MELVFSAPPRITRATFVDVLQGYRSPAPNSRPSPTAPIAGMAWECLAGYGLDPAVGLAFFHHETKFGTWGHLGPVCRNWGMVRTPVNPARVERMHPEGFVVFRTWFLGLCDWCERINTRYIARGLDTVDKAIPVYAPSSDGNRPAKYIRDVKELVAAWEARDARRRVFIPGVSR